MEACRQLGDALIEAWAIHGGRPEIPADEDEVIFARRLVAQRCLYGLDRNPVAVDLAKMSLWLATLASDHALTFLDHALRSGDALVGLSRRQIQAFHWDDAKPPLAPIRIGKHMERVVELRDEIRVADEGVSDFALRDMWDEAQTELDEVRLFGDLAVHAFFSSTKPRERESKRAELVTAVTKGSANQYRWLIEQARGADPPVAPFHWSIEFPEVFQRDAPGFDAIVGNPPFAGSVLLSASSVAGYTDWLRGRFSDTGGKADLVAYFFRRAYELLRPITGAFGLVATNTIRQGDTRESSLLPIARAHGWIYAATRRLPWPGVAAVTVAVVHVQRAPDAPADPVLDGVAVDRISAYLLAVGPDESPAGLVQPYAALLGVKPGSRAFVVDDNPRAGFRDDEFDELEADEPAASDLVRPYLTGEDLMSTVVPGPRRRIIDCGDSSLDDLKTRYPKTLALLREKIDPAPGAEGWQRFSAPARRLRSWMASTDHDSYVCTAETSTWHAVLRVAASALPSNTVIVFTTSSSAALCVLQSRVHEAWARQFSSTLKTDLRYVGSDCFETFPLPPDTAALAAAADRYVEHRQSAMARLGEGATQLYNRFHNPDEHDAGVIALRRLHAEMDRAVLDAYGWTDLPTDCEFLLDYEVEDESARRKKPWRYRWPENIHDEVLARLLALNVERAAEEQRSGAAAVGASTRKPAVAAKAPPQTEGLF